MTGRSIATALFLVAGAAWLGGVAPGAARAIYCSLDGCGTATLEPTSGTPGTVVTVRVDNGWFGEPWVAEMSSCLAAKFHTPGADWMPGDWGIQAPLTIVDADSATFVVPDLQPDGLQPDGLQPGDYRVAFICRVNEDFGQPEVQGLFTVLAVPATDAAGPGGAPTMTAHLGDPAGGPAATGVILAGVLVIGAVASSARIRRGSAPR